MKESQNIEFKKSWRDEYLKILCAFANTDGSTLYIGVSDSGLNERQIKAVLYVKEKGKITNKEYQQLNNCSRNTATNDLRELVANRLHILGKRSIKEPKINQREDEQNERQKIH